MIEGERTVEQLQLERADTIVMLRNLCAEYGDNDWNDNLHLSDIIEKHLMRHLLPNDIALREAIAFYADPEIYHAIAFMADPPCGEWIDDFDEAHGHPDYNRAMPGKRARAALK